jgi:Immunity protein 21
MNYRWITTTGGPHILLPKGLLGQWCGVEGWSHHRNPQDFSDYARACRVRTWLGKIPCGSGEAVVLSGESAPITWINGRSAEHGFLVQGIAIDDELEIEVALKSDTLSRQLLSPGAESIEIEVDLTGKLYLFDSSERGDDVRGEKLVLSLSSGEYKIRAAYYASSMKVVVREIVART